MKKKRLSNRERTVRRFVRNIKETWMNKLAVIAMLICSSLPMFLDGDATALIFMLMFAAPLFFATKQVIY